MCSVTHVAVGALLGSLVNNALAAFGLGVVSHIPLDAIPHFDFKDFRLDAVESVVFLVAVLVVGGLSPMLFGAIGSVLPDIENLLWKVGLLDENHKIFPTHSGLVKHGRARMAGGTGSEITVTLLSAGIIALAVLVKAIRGGTI
ncbi:MAG TPA: hypothetical protein VMU02_00260 [bacterium]|nr:hypothetical protein [bacterium]